MFDQTSKMFDQTLEMFDQTSKMFDQTLEMFDQTSEMFDQTLEMFDQTGSKNVWQTGQTCLTRPDKHLNYLSPPSPSFLIGSCRREMSAKGGACKTKSYQGRSREMKGDYGADQRDNGADQRD